MPNDLITVLGASGLLGSAVAATLAERPVRLRLVSRHPGPVPSGSAAVETVAADLTEPGVLEDVVRDAGAVLCFVKHTGGWRDAGSTDAERVNAGIMRTLVGAARRGATQPGLIVVYAGSASQMGPPTRVPLDGTESDQPDVAFDRQKLDAERELMRAARDGVLRGVSLRLPVVFGSVGGATDNGVVTAMTRRALSGAELTVWDGGAVRRDLLNVADAAAAFVAALDHAAALTGRSWLVGTGHGVRLDDLFSGVADAVAGHTGGPPVPVVSVPAPATATAGDASDLVLDSRPFRTITGWHPRVALGDGLRDIVASLATV